MLPVGILHYAAEQHSVYKLGRVSSVRLHGSQLEGVRQETSFGWEAITGAPNPRSSDLIKPSQMASQWCLQAQPLPPAVCK